jgi:hypothetical protein
MAQLIRLKQIESSSALQVAAAFGSTYTASAYQLPTGLISSSAQLDGTTINNLTIGTINSDKYSLIVSGALGIVNANNLPDGGLNDNDSNVPGQLWINGQSGSTQNPPTDPSIGGIAQSNVIDQGEW